MIGYLLEPRRHDLVVDFCADAEEVKMSGMMHSQGRGYASSLTRAARAPQSGEAPGFRPSPHSAQRTENIRASRARRTRVANAPASGLGTRAHPTSSGGSAGRRRRNGGETGGNLIRFNAGKVGGRSFTHRSISRRNEKIVARSRNTRFRAVIVRRLLEQQGIAIIRREPENVAAHTWNRGFCRRFRAAPG